MKIDGNLEKYLKLSDDGDDVHWSEEVLKEMHSKLTNEIHSNNKKAVELQQKARQLDEQIKEKKLEWIKKLTWLDDIKELHYRYSSSLYFDFNKKEVEGNEFYGQLLKALPYNYSSAKIKLPMGGEIIVTNLSVVGESKCEFSIHTRDNQTFINLLEMLKQKIIVSESQYQSIKIDSIVLFKSNLSKEFKQDMTEIMTFFNSDKE